MLLRVQLGAAQKFGMVPAAGAAAPLNPRAGGGGGCVCGVEEEAAAAAGGEVGREAAPQCCERPGGFSAALRRAGAASFPHCTARARGGHGAERARGERTRRGRACAQDRGV